MATTATHPSASVTDTMSENPTHRDERMAETQLVRALVPIMAVVFVACLIIDLSLGVANPRSGWSRAARAWPRCSS